MSIRRFALSVDVVTSLFILRSSSSRLEQEAKDMLINCMTWPNHSRVACGAVPTKNKSIGQVELEEGYEIIAEPHA